MQQVHYLIHTLQIFQFIQKAIIRSAYLFGFKSKAEHSKIIFSRGYECVTLDEICLHLNLSFLYLELGFI